MATYYCDGSQHIELNKIGLGVVINDEGYYFERTIADSNKNLHEIEAIKQTALMALGTDSKRGIVIINDDKNMVQRIQEIKKNLKIRTGNLKKKQEFKDLVKLLKENNIIVRSPESLHERQQIKRCHNLSRTYLNDSTKNKILS